MQNDKCSQSKKCARRAAVRGEKVARGVGPTANMHFTGD